MMQHNNSIGSRNESSCRKKKCQDNKRDNRCRHPYSSSWKLVLLFMMFSFLSTTAAAFCRLPLKKIEMIKDNVHLSSLHMFRPDWMRRAGRIEKRRQEKNEIFNSLRQRQDELGMMSKKKKKKAQRKYRVNNTTTTTELLLLNVYMFIPQDEYEINDRSNIMDQLKDGEIVTSVGGDEKGGWIEHDRGGWSPTVVDGITRLIPIIESSTDSSNE